MVESPMRENGTTEDNERRQSVRDMVRQHESRSGSNTPLTGRMSHTPPAIPQGDYFGRVQGSTAPSAQQERPAMAGIRRQSSRFWDRLPFVNRDNTPNSPPDPELTASPNSIPNDRSGSSLAVPVPVGHQRRGSNESAQSDHSVSNISDQQELAATIPFSEEDSEAHQEDRGTQKFSDVIRRKVGFEKIKVLFRTRTEDASNFIANMTGDTVQVFKAVDDIVSVLLRYTTDLMAHIYQEHYSQTRAVFRVFQNTIWANQRRCSTGREQGQCSRMARDCFHNRTYIAMPRRMQVL